MIIDFHTHCFPDALAARAIGALQKASGNIPAHSDGTAGGLIASMDRDGVDISVVLCIATNAHQQHSVNDFAASIQSDRLICFGSVHPESPDALEELDRIQSLGLRGVKFHPEYQQFFVDDEKMKPIYKKISQLGLPTVFHAGYDLAYGAPVHCSPQRLARALRWFDSPVVAAHWGAWCDWEGVLQHLCGLPLYFDTSFGQGSIPTPFAKEIVRRHGTQRIVFGSDSPWHTPRQDMDFVKSILPQAQADAVLGQNAQALLGL